MAGQNISWFFRVGVCCLVLKTLTQLHMTYDFPYPISDLTLEMYSTLFPSLWTHVTACCSVTVRETVTPQTWAHAVPDPLQPRSRGLFGFGGGEGKALCVGTTDAGLVRFSSLSTRLFWSQGAHTVGNEENESEAKVLAAISGETGTRCIRARSRTGPDKQFKQNGGDGAFGQRGTF